MTIPNVAYAVEWDAIHRPEEIKKFNVMPEMNPNVGILRIFPGITRATVKQLTLYNRSICYRFHAQVRSFLQPPMEGVVLQTYGAGNVPDTEAKSYLLQELRSACDRGVIVVNCTQCSRGVVTEMYAGGTVRPHLSSLIYMWLLLFIETSPDWGCTRTGYDSRISTD